LQVAAILLLACNSSLNMDLKYWNIDIDYIDIDYIEIVLSPERQRDSLNMRVQIPLERNVWFFA
jgi:hypothetical protein